MVEEEEEEGDGDGGRRGGGGGERWVEEGKEEEGEEHHKKASRKEGSAFNTRPCLISDVMEEAVGTSQGDPETNNKQEEANNTLHACMRTHSD